MSNTEITQDMGGMTGISSRQMTDFGANYTEYWFVDKPNEVLRVWPATDANKCRMYIWNVKHHGVEAKFTITAFHDESIWVLLDMLRSGNIESLCAEMSAACTKQIYGGPKREDKDTAQAGSEDTI